jgi:hypothetical protein
VTTFRLKPLILGLALTASAGFLFNPTLALAQGPPPPGGPWGGRGGPGPGPGPGRFGHGGPPKVVTGEPYSAQAVTTINETLSNGSNITRQITASIARDSEGRTMRSETFNGFGAAGSTATGATITTIFDPVANQRIELNSKNKTARIYVLPPPPTSSSSTPPSGPRGNRSNSSVSVQTTSLGEQTIAGVPAQGTQTTRTIAAGAIGNSQPLVSTETRWYSPDLEIVVQSSRTDPRFGQTSYALNSLQRSVPSASLFQVPAGYTSKTIDLPARGAAQ